MFPWLWIWSPRVDFPLSGNVTQDIAPEWFFSAIKPSAGHAKIEQDIFKHSSYGKQLGLMMDVLLPIAEGKSMNAKDLAQAVDKLKTLQTEIDDIKQSHRQTSSASLEEAKALLSALRAEQPEVLKALIAPYVDQP